MASDDVKNLSDDDWTNQAEQNLWELANGAEGMVEKLDKDGRIHELNYKLPPNPDVNKFIVKNRSRGKWADKTEITSTQININLTASFNEVNKLLEEQKLKIIAEQEQNLAIEADYVEIGEGDRECQ